MVFHPEAGWGGLPTRVQKTKIYLETDEYSSTPPFSKKHLAGVISQDNSGRNFSKTIWRELFQKHLAGTFKKYLAGTKKHIWREYFGRNILAGFFFYNSKSLQNAPF
jgi:hypothetical protein